MINDENQDTGLPVMSDGDCCWGGDSVRPSAPARK
jgi:hypothetical protein